MSNTQQIINQLNNTIGGFTGSVNVKIKEVNESSEQIRHTADTTLAEIRKFKTEMIENEQMQSAQESILRINQMIRERFYDYDTIRKTVMGVVKDFDLNLVRDKTIAELSEELWITSSRYWLSYTLIALSAWVNDNKDLADNAVSESFRADEVKTSLFFCLTNLRFGRVEVARMWLSEYFKTVVPEDLQNETAIMLQSYINGVFGIDEQIQHDVQSIIDEWINKIVNDEEEAKALEEMYVKFVQSIKPNNPFKSEYLRKYCTNFSAMPKAYYEASKYDHMIKLIKSVDVENIVQNAANFKKRVDVILKDLISNYDAEEIELKQQQEYFQLIIDNKGKEDVAQTQFTQRMEARNRKENFGKKCIEWALYASNEDINVHVRKFGFQNTKTWFLNVLLDWSNEFEATFPEEYNIKIDEWTSVSNGEDHQEQVNSLKEHLEKNKSKVIWDKIVKTRIVFTVIFLALLVVTFFLILPIEPMYVMYVRIIIGVLAFICFLCMLIRVLKGKSRFNKKVNAGLQKINGVMDEIVAYRSGYFANRDKKGELFSLIENL